MSKIVREINNYFNKEVYRIIEDILNGKIDEFNRRAFEKSFLYQGAETPDNIESIKHIEYGEVEHEEYQNLKSWGLKVKEKNIMISDVIANMETDEIVKIIKKKYPELSIEEIEAIQRINTMLILGLECYERIDEV